MSIQPTQQLHRKYRILAENALECIWTYNLKHKKFTFVSPSVLKLIGYTVGEAMDQSLKTVLTADSFARATTVLTRLVDLYAQGERREDLLTHCDDYELVCKDSTAKQVEITAKLIQDEKSGALELLGITRDVTRRKQLEQQLNQALQIKNEMIQRLRDSEKASKELAEELHQKNEILRSHATQDGLTGIYNRYYFDQKANEETSRCQRYRHPLSIILFDIDHFKQINDTLGHQAGDYFLVNVADTVRRNIRQHDTFARWGGDEFVLLMPHVTLPQAAAIAEKLRQNISAIQYAGHSTTISSSFGVVQFMQGETQESWFGRVDYALFRSKNEGRNRVTAISWETAIPFVQVKLEWKPEWACANPVINAQHERLLSLGNKLLDTTLMNLHSTATANALEELADHIRLHFDSEEHILRGLGYPNAEEHAAIHQTLLQKTALLQKQVKAGTLKISAVLSFLLDEVVTEHLLQEDIKFYPFLKGSLPSGGDPAP